MYHCDECCKAVPYNDRIFTDTGGVLCNDCLRKQWLCYILRCSDGSLYTGVTNNLSARIEAHNNGTGAKYTRGRGPVELVAKSRMMSRNDAQVLEMLVKKTPAEGKVAALFKLEKEF